MYKMYKTQISGLKLGTIHKISHCMHEFVSQKTSKIKNKRKEWPHIPAREKCSVGVFILVACCCFVAVIVLICSAEILTCPR